MPTLRTNATPDLSLDVGGGGESWVIQLLQPAVDFGGATYAPAGEPTGAGSVVFYGILALAAFGLYTLTRGIRA